MAPGCRPDATEGEHRSDEPEAVVWRRVLIGALRRVDHLRQLDRHHVSADLAQDTERPGRLRRVHGHDALHELLVKLQSRPHSHAQGTGNARVCARDVQIDYAL
jgi:hypothetical protein